MTPSEPKEALIDADFLVYRIGFASEQDDEKFARSRLTEFLTDIVYFHLKADDYKAYIGGKDNFRKKIAVTHEYKGNRKDAKKPVHAEALRDQLQKLGAEVVDGQEADDAVGIESSKGNYWIVHTDKDLNQLPGHHYNPITGEKYYVDEFTGLKNFYTQLLTGDSVDNIKGLWKIGPVKAQKLLQDCTTEAELYETCCKAYEDKKESHDRLIENAQLLWLRREPNQMWSPPQ